VIAKISDHTVTDPLGKTWFAWPPFVDDVVVKPNGQEIRRSAITSFPRKCLLKFVKQPPPLQRGPRTHEDYAIMIVYTRVHYVMQLDAWRGIVLEEERMHAAKFESLIELLGKGNIRPAVADEGALQIVSGSVWKGNSVVHDAIHSKPAARFCAADHIFDQHYHVRRPRRNRTGVIVARDVDRVADARVS